LRWVAYGYRFGEVPLPEIGPIHPSVRIGKHRVLETTRRPLVYASLGCHTNGMLMPHPCPNDALTFEAAVRKRFATDPPKADKALRERFRAWVIAKVCKEFKPLAPDTDVSFETWLSGTNYSEGRKNDLRVVRDGFLNGTRDRTRWIYRVKQFMKDEPYPEYKHPRPINSRSDTFKCEIGRFFKVIEKELYKHPFFIKNVPVADRPAFISAKFRPGKVMESDWKACEAMFTRDLMYDCEFILYCFLTRDLPEFKYFAFLLDAVIAGDNEIVSKYFISWCEAKRMSGEMNTSAGNGVSNWFVNEFMMTEVKKMTDFEGTGEGDDGLFQANGEYPTAADYKALGVNVELIVHDDLASASFCGIIFDPIDNINVTDPREVLAQFGWTSRQYAQAKSSKLRGLLRCKALSYAHQYPGCPIIDSLAQYGLRVTRDSGQCAKDLVHKQKNMNLWYKEQMLAAFKDEKKIASRKPGLATRFLVEKKFGLTVAQQLIIERYLDSLTSIQPLEVLPILGDSIPPSWTHYWDNYVQLVHIRRRDVEKIGLEWPTLSGFKPNFP